MADDFAQSYVGQLRAIVGNRLLLIPGARVVIEDPQGRILLQLRSDFRLWGLPGGSAEPGETLEQVVLREAFEETGLTLDAVTPFGFGATPGHETITYPNGDRTQYFVLNYYATSFSGALQIDNSETLQLNWFAPDDLPQMLSCMRLSVDAFLEFKRTGEFQIF